MASTGNVFPTVGASVDRAGSTAWTSPGNVVSDNATDATAVVPTDYLVTSSYGFSIPTDATIIGVTVRVEASESGTGSSNYVPQLISNTTPTLIGSAKGAVTVNGTTKVISTNGGAADLWGATLTPAIVNAAGFGVAIWSTDTTNTLAIDFVTIAIEYWVPNDDDQNSDWSGSKQNMVSVPRAGAAAALALAVAIQAGFNHNDEIPTAPPVEVISSAESVQFIPVGDPPLGYAFLADDEIVPQAAATLVDESEGPPQFTRIETRFAQVWNVEDDLPTRIDEDYWWQAGQRVSLTFQPPAWADEEIVPQPVAFSPVEEYWFAPQARLEAPRALARASDDEFAPQTTPAEEYWHSLAAKAVPPSAQPWAVNDEIVPQPAAFVPNEDYWYQPGSDPVTVVVVNWPAIGGGGSIPGAVTPLEIVESDWRVWTPQPVAAKPLYRAIDVEIVPQPAPGLPEETAWQVYTPPLVKARALYLPDPEQTPLLFTLAPGDGAAQAVTWRRQYTPELRLWEFTDELPVAPTPLPFDEEPWQVYTPPLVKARPLYLPDPEQVPAGSLVTSPQYYADDAWQVATPPLLAAKPFYLPDPEQFPRLYAVPDEAYWQPFKAQPATLVATLWAVDDQIVPQPAPGATEETEWRVQTPPWRSALATLWVVGDDIVPQPAPLTIVESDWQVWTPPLPVARFIYLPDPEQVFGTVVPPVYGWCARGRIGTTPAADPNRRIGSTTASDQSDRIGSEVASDATKRIGSDKA